MHLRIHCHDMSVGSEQALADLGSLTLLDPKERNDACLTRNIEVQRVRDV
jgi:hypothetical protein